MSYGRGQLIRLGARALEVSRRAADLCNTVDHAGQGAGRKVRNGLGRGEGHKGSESNGVLHFDWKDSIGLALKRVDTDKNDCR